MSHTMKNNGGFAKPKIIENFMWSLSQEREDDAGNTRMRKKNEMRESMMNKISNEH